MCIVKRIGIAVVRQGERVLVGVRPHESVLGGLHEFPGGKCRHEESPAACALRECQEETNLRVEVLELLMHRRHTYPHGTVDLSFYLCQPVEPSAVPAPPFEWVPIAELPQFTFPEANREVVEQLVARWAGGLSQA